MGNCKSETFLGLATFNEKLISGFNPIITLLTSCIEREDFNRQKQKGNFERIMKIYITIVLVFTSLLTHLKFLLVTVLELVS